MTNNTYLSHHGIRGMKWGQRRFQYDDGSLTPAGRDRYGVGEARKKTPFARIVLSKKKNTVDTDKDNLAGENNTKQPKVSGPRHRGNGQEEPRKPLTDEERAALVRSGNVKELLSRADELSPQEMTSAIQRARDIESLRQYSDKEEQRKQTIVDKAKGLLEKREEANRQKILRSGNADLILANQDKFSTNELNDALTRARYKSNLEEQARIERKAHNLIGKTVNFIANSADVLDKAISAKNKFDELLNRGPDLEALMNSPKDKAMAMLANMSKKKRDSVLDASDKINKVMTNLKDKFKEEDKKYDFSEQNERELNERYNKSKDDKEKAAIAKELDTRKKNESNADDIANRIKKRNTGNQDPDNTGNGQNGNQKQPKNQKNQKNQEDTKPKHEDDGKPIPKPDYKDKGETKSTRDKIDEMFERYTGNKLDQFMSDPDSYKTKSPFSFKREKDAFDNAVDGMTSKLENRFSNLSDMAENGTFHWEDKPKVSTPPSNANNNRSTMFSKEAVENRVNDAFSFFNNSKAEKEKYESAGKSYVSTLENLSKMNDWHWGD